MKWFQWMFSKKKPRITTVKKTNLSADFHRERLVDYCYGTEQYFNHPVDDSPSLSNTYNLDNDSTQNNPKTT